MSIEFVVFVVAVGLLIAYRNLGSGAISSAGGNVASGMKTAFGWLAGTGRGVAGSKVIILLVWTLFLAAIWYFDPTSWKELAVDHWKMFIFLNVLAIGLLFFATQWGLGATLVTFAIIGGIILMMSEPEKPKGVAQADRDDTGWVRDPKEPLSEVRQMMVYPKQPKVAIVSDQYRFDASCEGEAEINIYGRTKPVPCNPTPGTDHLGDHLRSVSGFFTLEFVTKTPVQVMVRRWPK